jgi:hypothetical protein
VASERYGVTLRFIRTVMAGHGLSVAGVAGAALLPPMTTTPLAARVFVAGLLALTLVRRLIKNGKADNVVSLVLLVPTLASLGCLARGAFDAGHPVWVPFFAYLLATAYASLCGRDFSFVGQFVITTFALSASLLVSGLMGQVSWPAAALWGLGSLVYVFFFVYDLAALLSRRRLDEAPAAVADLYRDLLNFLTYTVRIVLHWRRFRFI